MGIGPGAIAATASPSCICSQTCQSCRLVRSQNSIVSCGSKSAACERIGVEQPLADDLGAPRLARPERVHHHVIRMEASSRLGNTA